jgi:diguanylate cyclase (GGDEF)-like protein
MLAVRAHALADGGFVQTFTDVTRERESDARMRYMDDHDALTGLANRSRIRALLTDAIRHGAGAGTRAAVLIVDLDGFKAVNETYGHNTGDALLAEVGARLRVLAGSENAVARLGADEFAVVATGLRQATAVATLAARIVSSLAEPKAIRSDRLRTGASVGIALYPKDGDDADTLFRNAAAALDSAKAFGCNTFRFYDHAMGQAVSEQRQLEADLRKALDDDALDVHFQPKFNSQTLALSGFEALARWRHPERGNVSPGVFIPLAERCGLIRLLGQRILEKTCRCAAAWPRTYPVAVNVSVPQLRDGALKEQIEAILEETGLGASHLEIEVTESVVAEDGQTVLANLEAIRAMGIRVSLDDFGTGYSSLSYLRRFPFDKIKIDRAFVQGQADDPGVRVILEMILGMCQRLGLGTIGEGIETQAQLDVLREHGCTEVQGFLLGRPMPQGAAIAFIETVVAAAADPGGQAPAELMLAS